MSITLVTAPTQEPVSLAEAKDHLRETASEQDGLIAGYILAARGYVETYLRRSLLTQTWDFKADAWAYDKCLDQHLIVLPRPPVQSVTSVTYVDTDGVSQTLATDQYRLVQLDTGEAAITPAYGITWPTLRDQLSSVTVRFVAGYGSGPGSIPEAVRQAMLMLIGYWYGSRETVNVGNIVNEMPLATEALLFPHRVFY